MIKTCRKCGFVGDVGLFVKVGNICKICRKEYNKKYREDNLEKLKATGKKWREDNPEYGKKWREDNPEYDKKYSKKWRGDNPENFKEYSKKWREDNPEYKKKYREDNLEKLKATGKKWREDNPEYGKKYNKKYVKNRKKHDINFKLRITIRHRISIAIKSQSGKKAISSIKLLGCSIKHAREHLESQFKPGMSWDNHSLEGWHIDHIIPCASFDLTDTKQQKLCFHYTNLQPLWATENLSKSAKISIK